MIGSLRGVLINRTARGDHALELLVEVGGVGYRVVAPTRVLASEPGLGDAVFLYVHTHVREDALVLYGFPTRQERDCFEALIGAHGVGPAVALAVLSVHSPAALRRSVATDDVDALRLVPGIGPKTAARLLPELRDRLGVADGIDLAVVGPREAGGGGIDGRSAAALADLRAALAGLGYGPDEIRSVLPGLPAAAPVEELLRLALRDLAAAR